MITCPPPSRRRALASGVRRTTGVSDVGCLTPRSRPHSPGAAAPERRRRGRETSPRLDGMVSSTTRAPGPGAPARARRCRGRPEAVVDSPRRAPRATSRRRDRPRRRGSCRSETTPTRAIAARAHRRPRRNVVRDVHDVRLGSAREDHALHLADVAVDGAEVGESVITGHGHRDLRFHRPPRQSVIIATPRPIAVIEIVHRMPAFPTASPPSRRSGAGAR